MTFPTAPPRRVIVPAQPGAPTVPPIPVPRPAVPAVPTALPVPPPVRVQVPTAPGHAAPTARPAGRRPGLRQQLGQRIARVATGPAPIPATVNLTVTVLARGVAVKDAEVSVNDAKAVKTGDTGRVTASQISTGGKSVSVRVEAPGFFVVRKSLRPNVSNTAETITLTPKPHGGWILAGGLAILAVILYYLIPTLVSEVTKVPIGNFQPPSVPATIQPLDFAHAVWISPVQFAILGILLGRMIFTALDGLERRQIIDAIVAFGAAFIVIFGGSLRGIFVGGSDPALAWMFVSGAGVAVMIVALTGGIDLTAVAAFLVFLVDGALLTGSLGELGVVLKVSPGPVVTADLFAQLVVAKQWQVTKITFVIYLLLLASALLYGLDAWKPWDKKHALPWLSIVIGLAIVPIYALARSRGAPIGWLIRGILGLAVLLATMTRRYGSGAVSQGGNWSQIQLGWLSLEGPWDGLAMGLLGATAALVIFGVV